MKWLKWRRRGSAVALPELPDGRGWWGLESLRCNTETGRHFRVFEAVAGHDEAEAWRHAAEADARLDQSLMAAAIRAGQVADEFDWDPVSRLIERRAARQLSTLDDVIAFDEALAGMLQAHGFFLEDFAEEPATAIGGGVYWVH